MPGEGCRKYYGHGGSIMNGNAELLNFVYQNSQMGVRTIQQLLGVVKNEEFKRHLENEFREYKEFHGTARAMLNENGYDEKGIGSFAKLKTYLMINMETLTDKSNSNIAEMLIIGSNMGVINAVKNIHKYQDADSQILDLMKQLLKFEENNVQDLKRFLA